MRFAIFVAVVAAHIALVWYFLTLWHLAASEDEDQSAMTMVFLPPPELAPHETTREMGTRRAGPRAQPPQLSPAESMQQDITSQAPTAATSAPPAANWRDEAAIVVQAEAQHIVESEDRAARQAGALTARIKPLAGPRVHGPSFGWDPNPRYRWQRAPGGGFVIPLNDHCEIFVLIFVWAGCSIGELPPARGDLFKNMHPPVKYGDWDWRLDDP